MMTRQDMEQLGYHTRGTYRGPFSLEYCQKVIDELLQTKRENGSPVFTPGSLYIVSQDDEYNVVYTLTEQEFLRDQAHGGI